MGKWLKITGDKFFWEIMRDCNQNITIRPIEQPYKIRMMSEEQKKALREDRDKMVEEWRSQGRRVTFKNMEFLGRKF